MENFNRFIASIDIPVRQALQQLDELASDAILFLVDDQNHLLGSLTDGDLRRGFIKGLGLEDHLSQFVESDPKFIKQGNYDLKQIVSLRKEDITIFPVVDSDARVINVVNLRHRKSYLPVDALIMAGGRGERLKPLTDQTPKPLLRVGDKPIIEHNLDRLNTFGIDDIWISLGYLGNQIEQYLGNGTERAMRIHYVNELNPLGTAGALSLVNDFLHEHVLMMNSDLLTNIDFEEFFLFFEEQEADFAVACIPYQVNVPYAVMETENMVVKGFKEKPSYTHYANAGIYLMKKNIARLVPENTVFNATDLMELLIKSGYKVVSYPFMGYWMDIGRHEDYEKAQLDIQNLKL